MPFIENQGAKIYWDEQGQGEPILLIMGLGWPATMWHRTRPALNAHYRTIAFDNRGAGRSDVPSGPYSIATMAADAAAVLDAAGVANAHLLGASMGGMIAQEFALRYPGRLRSLVLACTACGGPYATQADPEVIQVLFHRQGTPAERAEAVVPFIYAATTPRERIDEDLAVLSKNFATPEGYTGQLQGIMAWESYSRLPEIQTRTLVVHGTNDRLVPAANSDLIASRIADAQVVKLPNASHIFMTDQPDRSQQSFLHFLASQASH
jgi:pimeloyl-ACP methyl ester carboxylesterase